MFYNFLGAKFHVYTPLDKDRGLHWTLLNEKHLIQNIFEPNAFDLISFNVSLWEKYFIIYKYKLFTSKSQ